MEVTYIEVERAFTEKGRKCHLCGEPIPKMAKFLYMRRGRHIYTLCQKCAVTAAAFIDKSWEEMEASCPEHIINHIHTPYRTRCHRCAETFSGARVISFIRHKYTFTLCSGCLKGLATELAEYDPSVAGDVLEHLV